MFKFKLRWKYSFSCNEHLKSNPSTSFDNTVKLVYKDRTWDPNLVAVVDKGLLLGGHLCCKSPI